MYSFSNLEPVHCSMSHSHCCLLTCIQISQEAGKVVWNSHLFKKVPQLVVIHTVKGFGIVSKAEVDVFLELSCFFDDPTDVEHLISGSSAFLKSSLNIWKCTVHVLLMPCLENFEHYFASMWDECKRICLSVQETWFNSWVRKIPWRRKWQPTPVLLPRKSHGQRSLVGYSPWGSKELDMTEWAHRSLAENKCSVNIF